VKKGDARCRVESAVVSVKEPAGLGNDQKIVSKEAGKGAGVFVVSPSGGVGRVCRRGAAIGPCTKDAVVTLIAC
jgi:hypothetical protein